MSPTTSISGEKMGRRKALARIGMMAAGALTAPQIISQALADPIKEKSAKGANRKPNIVLILVDDLGYGDTSCYGNKENRTPHLERLAKQGVRFTQFYVANPLCAPTRVSLMTGKQPVRTSLPNNPNFRDPEAGLDPKEVTIAQVLKKAGYATGLVGKWHLGYAPKFRPCERGFDEYFGFLSGWADYYEHTYNEGTKWMFRNREPEDRPGYMTDIFTEEAISFIDRHKGSDKPFFLYLAYNTPHSPEQVPDDWKERADGNVYRAMVENMDDAVGKVVKHIDDAGLGRDTLIVWMSDNGADGRGSNAPLRGHKGQLWEGGIRIPAIVRWTGRIPAGKVSSEQAVSMDLFTTFAKLGGGDPSTGIDGKDILPVMECKARSPHKELYFLYEDQFAIRRGDLKLVQMPGKPPQLFDLAEDIGEERDISAERPQEAKKLTDDLEKAKKRIISKDYEEHRRRCL